MSADLVPMGGGELVTGVTAQADLAQRVTGNFEARGVMAARLAVASLTETGFVAHVDGQEFGVPIPESPYDDGGPNTVEAARAALREYMAAAVPGTRSAPLESLPTQYRRIARRLWPGWRDEEEYVRAFDDALVRRAGSLGLALDNAGQARSIIRQAPTRVRGLRLSDHRERGFSEEQQHDFVTVDGRMLTVFSERPIGSNRHYYFLPTGTNRIPLRGGRAPSGGVQHDIGRRVMDLRTRDSNRAGDPGR